MSDFIRNRDRVNSTHPVNEPRTPAPRRDAPGSLGAFDPVKATSARSTLPLASRPSHGDFIDNSMDPVGSTHVHEHIVNGTRPPDADMGVRHASSVYPKRHGMAPFSQGDAGKGDNFMPHGDAGHDLGDDY